MRALGAVVALALLASCGGPEPASPNAVDEALLRPALLDDREHMKQYMAELPPLVYKEYSVPGLGAFHVDSGNDIIKAHLIRGLPWEQHLVGIFAKHVRPGTTVIDAGAHIGTHAVTLSRLAGPAGRVYAFEPQRKLYRELVFNLRLNDASNVVPLRFALGDAPGVIEMNVAVRGNEGGTQVGAGGDRAELRTIDSFRFRNVSFMKIDVESFEDKVLAGARATIEESRPVLLVEIQGGQRHDQPTPEVREKIAGTLARLAALRYRVERVSAHDYLAIPL